jgi:hypothetical protein
VLYVKVGMPETFMIKQLNFFRFLVHLTTLSKLHKLHVCAG